MSSRPGRAAVTAWLRGQRFRANASSPFLGPRTLTWPSPQPEKAGQRFLPRRAVAISKQVLWLYGKEGNFREDGWGARGGEGRGSSDSRAF